MDASPQMARMEEVFVVSDDSGHSFTTSAGYSYFISFSRTPSPTPAPSTVAELGRPIPVRITARHQTLSSLGEMMDRGTSSPSLNLRLSNSPQPSTSYGPLPDDVLTRFPEALATSNPLPAVLTQHFPHLTAAVEKLRHSPQPTTSQGAVI